MSAGEAPSELTEEELDAMDTEKAATDTQYEARAATDARSHPYRAIAD